MPDMTPTDYAKFVEAFAIHPGAKSFMSMEGLTYSMLGLNGEAGECAEIVKKALRRGAALDVADRTNLLLELGDVLWYVTNAARILGADLSQIMEMNVEKLTIRRASASLAKKD